MEMMTLATSHTGRRLGPTTKAGFGYGFSTLQNPSWTLDQILLATGGRLASGEVHASFRSIATDSRTIKPGDIFLALAGENYDGAAFVGDALKKGAAGIITSKPAPVSSVPVIVVDDTLTALGDLACYRRAMMNDLKVLAVTGSSGKTTVKEMTASILGACGKDSKNKGNCNHLIGLPLSLLPVSYRHDFAVLEMGMNAPGEILRLTEIADPDVACINNIQEAHLSGLGDINGVARAKGELFDNSRSSATLVVNYDDKNVRRLVRNSNRKIITFGRHKKADVRATRIYNHGEQGSSFTLHIASEQGRVHLHVLGEHNVLNSLAAAAMAYAVDVKLSEIITGLESFTQVDKRLQLTKLPNGLRIINDSYNANPSSMQAALVAARNVCTGKQCAAVLGDMLELGKLSVEAHARIGEMAARQGFDYLLAIGDYAGTMAAAARKAGMKKDRVRAFASKSELAMYIDDMLNQGLLAADDLLLLKGSRGMRMEEIIEMLCTKD